MKKFFGILIILILATAPIYLISSPQSHSMMKKFFTGNFFPDRNPFDGRFVLNAKKDIQLSNNQERNIENLMISFEEYSISICSEIKILELRLVSYLKSDKIDRKEVARLIREINLKRTTVSIRYLNYILDIKSLLTAKQIDHLKKIKKTIDH